MWDVKLDIYVRPLDLHLDWYVAIAITLRSKKCTTFNVYMPYQCHDNVEKLGILKAITDKLNNTCCVISGDWNVILITHYLQVIR